MNRTAVKTATEQTETKGEDRNPAEPSPSGSYAPNQNPRANAASEQRNRTENMTRPPPNVPRSQPTQSKEPTASSLSAQLSTLNLLDRFLPEARDLQPALVQPAFNAQMVYTQVFDYFHYRFNDIAYSHDSTIAYVPQVIPAAHRVAIVTLNAIVNKLIIGNRTDGLAVNILANPIGPPKGFLFPSVATAVITAIGKTCPIWSGDQYFIPDLANAIPGLNDHAGNAVNNVHIFPANPAMDSIVARLCSTGNIPMRSTDWKIPGGTPHWLVVSPRVNGRINALVAPDVHPDNYDPPNTVLSCLASCTNFDQNNCRYVIMRGVAETTVWSLISASIE